MNPKTGYPFDPFVDSLVGEKILYVWESTHHNQKELEVALFQNTGQTSFYFTPNATKQILMVSYPTLIRSLLESRNYQKIGENLLGLANGKLTENHLPALDITLELLEWLLTGFDIDLEISQYLQLLFSNANIIDVSFVEQVRSEYVKELRG